MQASLLLHHFTRYGPDHSSKRQPIMAVTLNCTFILGGSFFSDMQGQEADAEFWLKRLIKYADFHYWSKACSAASYPLLLCKVGFKVLVLEREPAPRHEGSAITFWPNAFRVLDALGVAAPVRSTHPLVHRCWRVPLHTCIFMLTPIPLLITIVVITVHQQLALLAHQGQLVRNKLTIRICQQNWKSKGE